MPISVITNFSINDSVPFDTRLVATSSTSMDNMLYKYAGLTTYRSDLGLNYTYNGSVWAVSSNGIYGGSGNLSSANTTVNFGTVSSALNSSSNKFVLKSYSGGDSNPNSLRLENYFQRHDSEYSGVSYKSQFIFSQNEDQGIYYGAYIMYNPKPLFNSGRGGISFGVLPEGVFSQDTESADPYERMRIDGNGIIRFKTNLTVNPDTKSVNIGIDSTNTRPFIGFNWNGSDVDTGTDASYVQFNDSVVSIHNFSSSTGTTHSAIFSKGLVRVNGALTVTGGAISTNKSISFGADDNLIYYVSNNFYGIKVDNQLQVASLVARQPPVSSQQFSSPTFVEVINYNKDLITLRKNTKTLLGTTITTEGRLNARYVTNIWDNNFDPELEFFWEASALPGDNEGQDTNSNTIIVTALESTTGPLGSRFYDFEFRPKAPYNLRTSKASFFLNPTPYDRYLYFYNENENSPISHLVEWFLLSAELDDLSENWVKIGRYENGNKDDYNIDFPGSTTNYQTRFYSHSVLIPANMYFKISFVFNKRFGTNNTYSNVLSFVRTRIIRAGKWLGASPGPRDP
jgi:hypothetical protein